MKHVEQIQKYRTSGSGFSKPLARGRNLTPTAYLIVLSAFRCILGVPLFLLGPNRAAHVGRVAVVIVPGEISPVPSSASHSRL